MTDSLPHGVRLTIAYDGTAFHGWQAQPGQRTVQGEVLKAVRMMSPSSSIRGASRTDSGVHAKAQIASFAAARQIHERGWLRGLNGYLPDDIAITNAETSAASYDPRDDSTGKLYRYQLFFGPIRDPLLRNRAWHIEPNFAHPKRTGIKDWLDVSAMQEAGTRLVGTHDFRAFQAANDHRDNSVRTLTDVSVQRSSHHPNLCILDVAGTAFLKNMVRILVGTLAEVGRGKQPPEWIHELLAPTATRSHSGRTAPAHGLCLEKVYLGRLNRLPARPTA